MITYTFWINSLPGLTKELTVKAKSWDHAVSIVKELIRLN
jgi:hypothetical protein